MSPRTSGYTHEPVVQGTPALVLGTNKYLVQGMDIKDSAHEYRARARSMVSSHEYRGAAAKLSDKRIYGCLRVPWPGFDIRALNPIFLREPGIRGEFA